MNDLTNEAVRERNAVTCTPIPKQAIYVLILLFFIGLSVSIFILIAVHNALFFIAFFLLAFCVSGFIAWNTHNWRLKASIFHFVNSFPDSDLASASHGQLVKITGLASRGRVSLESSYERATGCIYTSTLLYEHSGFRLKPQNFNGSHFRWTLRYCERFSTDFYVTDRKSGLGALVKAGSGCKVYPLIVESSLVTTAAHSRNLSPHLRKWLQERNLTAGSHTLRLEEGYIQEGSFVTIMGVLHKTSDLLMIVQPQELYSTGCFWQKLFIPVDIDGVILAVVEKAGSSYNRQQNC